MKEYVLQFQLLLKTIKSLRGKNGCPWDKKQTNESLIKYLKEESHELVEAIEKKENLEICEELGDLFFIILILCEINEEQEHFSLSDMLTIINEKLIRRHPHVFAGRPISDEKCLKKQWLEIKAMEKEKKTI